MACEDGGDGKSPQQHVCGQQWVQARLQEFRGYSVWGLPPVPIPLPLPLPYSTVATSAARLRPPQRRPPRPQRRRRPQRETTAMTTTTTTGAADTATPIWPPPPPRTPHFHWQATTRPPLPLALQRSRTSIFMMAAAISALLCFRVSRDAALPAALRIPDLVVRRSFKVVFTPWDEGSLAPS